MRVVLMNLRVTFADVDESFFRSSKAAQRLGAVKKKRKQKISDDPARDTIDISEAERDGIVTLMEDHPSV